MQSLIIFFSWCGFGDAEGQSFLFFPAWLPHHVTYDVIIIIQTLYMSSRSFGENFVSICQAVAVKNRTHVLCGQTNRQTDPNAIPSSSGEGNETIPLQGTPVHEEAMKPMKPGNRCQPMDVCQVFSRTRPGLGLNRKPPRLIAETQTGCSIHYATESGKKKTIGCALPLLNLILISCNN